MKSLIKKLFGYTFIWRIVAAPLIALAHRFEQLRYSIAREKLHRSWQADWRVRSGPFTGMIYPELSSCGSALAAKILGVYERELHATIERLVAEGLIDTIYDIGCAEGYYAVGLARPRHGQTRSPTL